ncbi:cupredoxin domain-containing protein [Gluconacetobacter tumulisoli]|nr:cupredoxin domain-containing protein [Gluconacetobacter tumulisoli]
MRTALLLMVPVLLSSAAGAWAQDPIRLVVKAHRFTPDHVTVPAGQRFLIELTNQDDTVDEFESYDMKFEKIVVQGATIRVHAGPLHPGTYKFFDDYHPDTATGTVTAVEAN